MRGLLPGSGSSRASRPLLSEEYGVAERRQLGNTPQAFSMVGLVNTARHPRGGQSETTLQETG